MSFLQKIVFDWSVVCKMAAIVSRPQDVNMLCRENREKYAARIR